MIFSATIPAYIQKIAKGQMKDPIMVDLVGDDQTQLPDTIKTELVLTNNWSHTVSQIKKFVTNNQDLKILIFS